MLFIVTSNARKKSHDMSLHRHVMTHILIRNYPCPVLPAWMYSSYRLVNQKNVSELISVFYGRKNRQGLTRFQRPSLQKF